MLVKVNDKLVGETSTLYGEIVAVERVAVDRQMVTFADGSTRTFRLGQALHIAN